MGIMVVFIVQPGLWLEVTGCLVIAQQIRLDGQASRFQPFCKHTDVGLSIIVEAVLLVMVVEPVAQIASLADIKDCVVAARKLLAKYHINSTYGIEVCTPGMNCEPIG